MTENVSYKKCICDVCKKQTKIPMPLTLPKDWEIIEVGEKYDVCAECYGKIKSIVEEMTYDGYRDANEEEPQINWNEIPVDTPVLVKNLSGDKWERRHFAAYDGLEILTWKDGKTSWTDGKNIESWRHMRLANDPEEKKKEKKCIFIPTEETSTGAKLGKLICPTCRHRIEGYNFGKCTACGQLLDPTEEEEK